MPRKGSKISGWAARKHLLKQHKNLDEHFTLVAGPNLGTQSGLMILTLNLFFFF